MWPISSLMKRCMLICSKSTRSGDVGNSKNKQKGILQRSLENSSKMKMYVQKDSYTMLTKISTFECHLVSKSWRRMNAIFRTIVSLFIVQLRNKWMKNRNGMNRKNRNLNRRCHDTTKNSLKNVLLLK